MILLQYHGVLSQEGRRLWRDDLAICTALYVAELAVMCACACVRRIYGRTGDEWPIRVAGERLLDSIGRYFRTNKLCVPFSPLDT